MPKAIVVRARLNGSNSNEVVIKLADLKKVCSVGKPVDGIYPVARHGVNKARLK